MLQISLYVAWWDLQARLREQRMIGARQAWLDRVIQLAVQLTQPEGRSLPEASAFRRWVNLPAYRGA